LTLRGGKASDASAGLDASPFTLMSLSMMNVNQLPVVYYSFLDPSPVGRLPENEVLFLKSQGWLHMSSWPVMENLLSRYVLYVHPFLPLVDENRI
jgi:hypothetical protein